LDQITVFIIVYGKLCYIWRYKRKFENGIITSTTSIRRYFMKKLVLLALFVACVSFVFISCAGVAGGVEIIFDQNDPTAVKDGSVFAPNSLLKFAWSDPNGMPVVCDFILEKDGTTVEERTDVTEVVLTVEEEGVYKAYFIPANASGSRGIKIIGFTVNRMYEELYNTNHGLYYKEDVSQLFAAFNAQGQETAEIAFYRLNQEAIEGTTEVINTRERLNLVDSNDDGYLDSWEVVSAAEQMWYVFPTGTYASPYGTVRLTAIQYGVDSIKLVQTILDGPYAGYTLTSTWALAGLELGRPYTRYINGGAAGTDYGKIIKLSERYDSDTVPEFYLLEETDASDNRGNLTIDVCAPNVADFGAVYNTKYMQVAVSYPVELTLASVDFGNFVAGTKEVCTYKVLEYETENVVLLYRGLIPGTDEEAEATDFFAKLNFTTPEETGEGEVFLTYSVDDANRDAYGPLFRNDKNENLDGFVINDDSVEVIW